VNEVKDELKVPLANLLLSVADDKFVLGHRNADWTGLAPILEEDIAFSSLAQDELAHASALYQIAADLLNTKADKLAYGRAPADYRCAQLVELSDEFDWGIAIARNFFCDHFDFCRLSRLANSAYPPVAQLAARLVGEEKIHVDHVDSWIARLAKGSARPAFRPGADAVRTVRRRRRNRSGRHLSGRHGDDVSGVVGAASARGGGSWCATQTGRFRREGDGRTSRSTLGSLSDASR